ncbi:MAG: hypothetical protein Q8J76_13525 [Desulfobulbaceae bacterium]|nr:hypothetical protein [Desulfobulbaceae bacterium]
MSRLGAVAATGQGHSSNFSDAGDMGKLDIKAGLGQASSLPRYADMQEVPILFP